jgi:peptidoglycan/LPS O-acetylase OafA/YrhL
MLSVLNKADFEPSRGNSRLPGLDGLRAVAVVMVLLGHFMPPTGVQVLDRLVEVGGFGVSIFFVLSGFIITHLLIREESSKGRVSIPLFYARRALRILPPLLAFLCFLAIGTLLGVFQVPVIDFWAGLFFVRNYFGTAPESGHLWTLAIEEQFYLIWPLVFVFFSYPNTRITIISAIVFLSPFWRQFCYYLAGGAENVNSWRTDLRLEPIAIGTFLAILLSMPKVREILQKSYLRSTLASAFCIFTLFLTVYTNALDIPVIRAFRGTLSFLAVAGLINCCIHSPFSIFTRLLELKPVVWVGTLSYSLYLWQQPFASQIGKMAPAWFRQAPINLVFAFGLAIASYYLLERPLMSLRKKLH